MKSPSQILKEARLNQPKVSYIDFIRQVQEQARITGRSNERIRRAVPPDKELTIESLFRADMAGRSNETGSTRVPRFVECAPRFT